MPLHEIALSPSRFNPFVGAIDEASVWSRPLSGAELAALSSSARSLPARLEPWRAARAAAVRFVSENFRAAVRVFDRLVPSGRGPAALCADLPELELVLSKKDERHFLSAHEKSLLSGWRTRAASRGREVLVRWKGRDGAAFFSLDDAYGAGLPGRRRETIRPSILLRGAPGFFAPGSGLARLVPPERWSEIRPDAPDSLPPPDALVRVFLDGDFRGLHALVPFDGNGGAWRISGAPEYQRPDHLFHGSAPTGRGGATAEEAEADRRETRALLRSDPHFPWSAAEVRWRTRLHRDRRAANGFAPPALSALDLMGNNPSPFYVTNDVDLAAAGPGVAWRSSDPAALDAGGTVRPVRGDLPRVVELSGTFPDGSERTFRFRVMPDAPRLPALFLYVGDPVRKERRSDFTAVRIPAGGGAPEFRIGTSATGGGVRHRGNTSYARGARRSLSLEFDAPVGWTGAPEPVSHVLLLSGYADATRLKNAFSFDAFAAMHPDAPRGAVPVSWTEVFVNGEWAGIWETVPRLKDMVSAWASPVYKVRSPSGLWSRVSADMLDRRDADPDAGAEEAYGPFLEAARFAAASSDEEFAARAAEVFDLDDLVDMVLLLDFTGNEDGRITNQYVVRRRSDGRWLVLPWDYDKTFLTGKHRDVFLSNSLYERCKRLVPGFRDRLCARWAALRAGPLSDEAVDRWIDEKSAFIAPFMDEDFRLVQPIGFDGTYPEAVEGFRVEVRYRLRRCDRLFAPAASP